MEVKFTWEITGSRWEHILLRNTSSEVDIGAGIWNVIRRSAEKAIDSEAICALSHIGLACVLLMFGTGATLRLEWSTPMNESPDSICQWNDCEALADKHVRFGFRILHSADGPCGNAYTTMPDHYDLCEPHVDESKSYYLQIAVNELNGCPSGCGEQS